MSVRWTRSNIWLKIRRSRDPDELSATKLMNLKVAVLSCKSWKQIKFHHWGTWTDTTQQKFFCFFDWGFLVRFMKCCVESEIDSWELKHNVVEKGDLAGLWLCKFWRKSFADFFPFGCLPAEVLLLVALKNAFQGINVVCGESLKFTGKQLLCEMETWGNWNVRFRVPTT